MKKIRNRRNGYAALFAAAILLMAWLVHKHMMQGALLLGTAAFVLIALLIGQSRMLYHARLICDNRIISVPAASIFVRGNKKMDLQETVISAFGMLIGGKVHKWGCDGVGGMRVTAIRIDRVRIHLTFSDGLETAHVQALHGFMQKQAVLEARQRLWHETGVAAQLQDWQ